MPGGYKHKIIKVNDLVVELNYPEIVVDKYRYRRVVSNQNLFRYYGRKKPQISLDST